MKESDPMHSTVHIRLLFTVKPDFERIILGWEGRNQIVLLVY